MVGAVRSPSQTWGYIRIISGTILGGALGFYVMHRLEVSYKEKMKQNLINYEREMKRRQGLLLEDEFKDSSLPHE
ncbi:ATP-dependent helicase/nuclease subunit [Thalictrum thalictroides]|uniref:ATP-dependent helicase/nuclease subunit n=1 Tax=Thalictrum thalictroides TaxID=46969 RepID=A0A7J6URH8_THATH|nr:ATP-dependent helicase/nuclease subunit [Thalictrum thalictroides]